MRKGSLFFLILFASASFPSARAGEVLTPEGFLPRPVWTEEEKQQEISRKNIQNTPDASTFWIRLSGSEKAHTHMTHDLTVVIVEGRTLMHLGAQVKEVQKGDVVEIPRGIIHWAENKGSEPALVYAVFSPRLEGKDYHEASA